MIRIWIYYRSVHIRTDPTESVRHLTRENILSERVWSISTYENIWKTFLRVQLTVCAELRVHVRCAVVTKCHEPEHILTWNVRGTLVAHSDNWTLPIHYHYDRHVGSWFSLWVPMVDSFVEVPPGENFLKYTLSLTSFDVNFFALLHLEQKRSLPNRR